MDPVQLKYKGRISGDFKASFSTTIIGEHSNDYSLLRNVNIVGRKVIVNCVYTDFIPSTDSTSIFIKEDCITDVEMFPSPGQLLPLDIPRKLSLFNILIYNVNIENQQDINGVMHGVIRGTINAELSRFPIQESHVVTPLNIPIVSNIDSLNQTHSEYKADTIVDSSTNNGCIGFLFPTRKLSTITGSGAQLATQKGCFPRLGNGCLSLFLLLFLLGFLLGMIGYCAADKNRQVRNPEKTKEDKWGNRKDDETKVKEDQDDLIKFNIIKEKDSNIIINDKKIREFRTISLPNVQFYTNKSELLPTSKKDLDKLGIYLLENLDLRATIFGHTDNVGEKQKNLLLSQARAESVMAYLIHIGVSSDRLKAIGKGDEEPRADNTSEEGRLMNRRVEVEVVGNKNN